MCGTPADVPVRFLAAEHGFPIALRGIDGPPREVWIWGAWGPGASTANHVAIVGSRAASGAGCGRANAIAAAAARADLAVVSGGAFGIDAAAHQGAVDAGGRTIAVLGCGIDVVYPDRHVDLFERIRRNGCLLSEHGPGVAPRPGQFPVRNRIIVGLARVVVVVEAAPRSGALITARLAAAAGRTVLAVPGSVGTDDLIADGRAVAVADPADVVAILQGRVPEKRVETRTPPTTRMAEMLAALESRSSPDELAARLGRPISEVMSLLTEAELDGWVRRGAQGAWKVNRG